MLNKTHLKRYADVLIWGLKTARTQAFDSGDIVLVRFDLPALELAEILQVKLLEMGIHPVLRLNSTATMEKNFYGNATDGQLIFKTPGARKLLRSLNGSISLNAPQSLTHLRKEDPKKIGKAIAAKKGLRDIINRREAKGQMSWTLCYFPTQALARQAGLSDAAYSRQIIKACFLDKKDPISHWKRIYTHANAIKTHLTGLNVKHFHVTSDNMDLIIKPGRQRRWLGITGRNIPSFEIFTSPDWRGTHGLYYADQSSFRSGNHVKDVRIEFDSGKIKSVSAAQGEAFMKDQLSMDKGASRVGEFSLTDIRFSKINRFMANTLYDENYGGKYGNCHIALGSSYANAYAGDPSSLTAARKKTLGLNTSALHWDLVNTENKKVTAELANGKTVTVYQKGKFLSGF